VEQPSGGSKHTPPKSNIDTQNDGFWKCISSFRHGVILGIHVSFQGCIFALHGEIHSWNEFPFWDVWMKLAWDARPAHIAVLRVFVGLLGGMFFFSRSYSVRFCEWYQTPEFHELWDNAHESFHYKLEWNLKLQKKRLESLATSYSPYVALRIVTFTWESLQHVTCECHKETKHPRNPHGSERRTQKTSTEHGCFQK